MRVSEIMTRDPITIPGGATVREAMRLIEEYRIRHLPVVESGRLVGVLSDRDLFETTGWLVPRLGEDLELSPGMVRDVMHSQPVTVTPEEEVSAAATRLTEFGIGCVPVLRVGALVGMVTETDLLRTFADACRYGKLAAGADPPLHTRMTAEVVVVERDATIEEASGIMKDGGFRHLPVVDGDRILGLVSDRDLRLASGRGLSEDTPIVEIMPDRLFTAEPDGRMSHAARLMAREKIGALPIEEDGSLVGIVTLTDLLEHCAAVLGRSEARKE